MKKIIAILITTILLLVNISLVNADTTGQLNLFYEDNIYYEMKGNNFYMSYPFPFYTISNHTVYCIEPGVNITSLDYSGKPILSLSPYSEEINKKIELIGHYGYEYHGHNTSLFRVATQVLMWETISDKTTEIRTKQYGYGEKISIDKEKNEILSLVNNHYLKPSFDNGTYHTVYGKNLIIEDTNQVLSKYDIIDTDKNIVKTIDNKLYITPQKYGTSKIILQKKKYDNETTIIFTGSDGISQKLAKFRASDTINSEIILNTFGAKLKIIKVDKETGKSIPKSKIKFKIKDISNNEYICEGQKLSKEKDPCIYETDNSGTIITSKYLFGDYLIEELEDSIFDGYVWNKNPLFIHINQNSDIFLDKENTPVIITKFENERVKGKVNIKKNGEKLIFEENTYKYEEVPLDNVEIGLYAQNDIYINGDKKYSKNELIAKVITENGLATIDNLELGKYYLKEISTDDSHVLDDSIYPFELKYQDQHQNIIVKNIELKNYYKKGTLHFIKTDLQTNKPIPNTLIDIYAYIINDDKEIVSTLIYTGYTDELGEIILSDLFVGKGYIVEKESASGYQLSKEIIPFEIKEDGEIVKVNMTNKQIVKVPDTYLNSKKMYNYTSISFIMIGIYGLIHVKKK